MPMRDDQRRSEGGQFGMMGGRGQDEERLEYPIGCKVSSREVRMYSILFDQHRKQFGWQTMSDMYRTLLGDGYKEVVVRVKNPSKEMLRNKRRADELEKIQSEANKHRELTGTIEKVDRDIDETFRGGDLAGVRRILLEFRANTEIEDDPALKNRRRSEYEKRWQRMDESLNRGASLIDMEDE